MRQMQVNISPATIIADRDQVVTVTASDLFLEEAIPAGYVFVNGARVGALGQPIVQRVNSVLNPKACKWVRDDNGRQRRECEPAYRSAKPLIIEVRRTNYESRSAALPVIVPD